MEPAACSPAGQFSRAFERELVAEAGGVDILTSLRSFSSSFFFILTCHLAWAIELSGDFVRQFARDTRRARTFLFGSSLT